ncbi:MAG: NAD(P)/FAD-dependent oxidoreductase [Acidobacteriota bacterium]|nr:NAD(P)/FAD-dependent oxidoreductase [Acidobacteriota bacterium]
MTKKFDLVAIGTGTAASTVAEACRGTGWQVAIVDSKPFGGTCQLRGCDPKKVLVGASDVIDWARRMTGKGINGEAVRIQWPELMRFKRTFTDSVPKQREEGFAREGIATFHGRARFIGPTAIQVGDQTLEARYITVAAGATPAKLKIPGEELITTSEQFLELDALPRRIVFVGGGYISFEFAHVAARAGAQVTILHRGSRVLAGFDPDLVNLLVEATRDLGVDIRLNTVVDGVEKVSSGLAVRGSAAGQSSAFETDMAVHGAGRVPDIDDLGLDVAGVESNERRGLKVNEYLQSVSNSAVYAAGDCAASGGLPLTPVAGYEGRIVADNLLKGNHAKPEYSGVPTVVFTTPPLAAVGLQERDAHEQGMRFRTNHANTSGWYSSRRVAEKYSGYKVLIEEGTDRILGAHLLGSSSDELINIFAVAIRSRILVTALRAAIFAYPTHGSDITYMLS